MIKSLLPGTACASRKQNVIFTPLTQFLLLNLYCIFLSVGGCISRKSNLLLIFGTTTLYRFNSAVSRSLLNTHSHTGREIKYVTYFFLPVSHFVDVPWPLGLGRLTLSAHFWGPMNLYLLHSRLGPVSGKFKIICKCHPSLVCNSRWGVRFKWRWKCYLLSTA